MTLTEKFARIMELGDMPEAKMPKMEFSSLVMSAISDLTEKNADVPYEIFATANGDTRKAMLTLFLITVLAQASGKDPTAEKNMAEIVMKAIPAKRAKKS